MFNIYYKNRSNNTKKLQYDFCITLLNSKKYKNHINNFLYILTFLGYNIICDVDRYPVYSLS